MITVTQAFKDVHARRSGKDARVLIRYKRRRWDTATLDYVYESSWQTLQMRDFVDPGEIPSQLDVGEPNVFKSTAITLRLRNTDNRWHKSANSPSIFAAGGEAADGWDDYKTLFQVTWGYKLADGTWEDIPQFTGYAYDFTPLPGQGYMQVSVSASLLAERTAASKINTKVTGGALNIPGTSPLTNIHDGVTADLTTDEVGVISVTKVYADGTQLVLEEDYTVAGTREVGAATVTLLEPGLWSGMEMTWDGYTGQMDKTIEQLVALLCDEMGVTSSSRAIQNVVYPGGLSASRTLDSEAEWAAGLSLSNVSATLTPGSLRASWSLLDDFSDGEYANNPTWSVIAIGGGGSITAAGGELAVSSGGTVNAGSAISTPLAQTTGTWQFRMKSNADTTTGGYVAFFTNSTAFASGNLDGPGYAIRIASGNAYFVRYSGTSPSVPVTIISIGSVGTGYHTYRITRTSAGEWEVFLDGVSVGTATDTTYTSAGYFIVWQTVGFSGNLTTTVDDIYYSPDINPTTYVADYQYNLGSTPAALGTITTLETLNGGTITVQTATAPDSGSSPAAPGAYDAFQVLGAGGQMQSTPRQWLKIRVTFTLASGSLVSPQLHKLVARFTSSVVTVSLAMPSGSVWDQVQKYAKMANYETGFDASGTFFFRARAVSGDTVIDLTPWKNISGPPDDTHPGYDEVVNIGRVNAGGQEFFYDKDDAAEVEPTSERRFGPIEKPLDFSGDLLANDVQLAQAIAQVQYEDNKDPYFRCRVPIKHVPWLELSDPVSLTWVPDPKMIENYAGDPLQLPGFAGPQGVALAIERRMKVVGITKKLLACQADLLLKELPA